MKPRDPLFVLRYPHLFLLCCSLLVGAATAKQPPSFIRFLQHEALQGASLSLMVQEVETGRTLYSYDVDRKLSPASLLKTVTTATALELLGEEYCYNTSLSYDGTILHDTLYGHLLIRGQGDPTINSSEFKEAQDVFLQQWVQAIKRAGIRHITGTVIADESLFDTEGVSMKWMREDLGSAYGHGSYGLNIFDNQYTLYMETEGVGTKPRIRSWSPERLRLIFHNYLTTNSVQRDSCYIVGGPFSAERSLYGVLPAYKTHYKLTGDIPDPPLFFAQYVADYLRREQVGVDGAPTCYRLLSQAGAWQRGKDSLLVITTSPSMREIVQVTNFVSHNLYADALVKTLGAHHRSAPAEVISSFERGTRVVHDHWSKRGFSTESVVLFDGSGLAVTNKLTTRFLCELYRYMITQSPAADPYFHSFPMAGREGTVRSFLRGTPLEGCARLKSGSMSGVRCYGGYITKGDKQYVVALMINNFSGADNRLKAAVEELFVALF